MADAHSKIFIENLKSENTEEYRITIDMFNSILRCTDLPGLYPIDESSSTMTFGFWYTLQVCLKIIGRTQSVEKI